MEAKTKILFVSHESGIGGSTVSLVSLIQGLKEEDKLSIKVLIPNSKGKAAELLKKKNIEFKKMTYRRNYKRISQKYTLKFRIFDLLNTIAVKKICAYIKKEKIDIVCSNSTGVDVGAMAARLAGVPHIYYVREFMEKDHKCEYRNKKRMKNLLENSEHLVFISNAIKDYYLSQYEINEYNTSTFFNGFIVQDYLIENHEIMQNNDIQIIQVGSFSDGKGTLDTINMLYQLNQSGFKNWKMEFVGKGTKEYVEKMRERIVNYNMGSQITISEFCLDIKRKLAEKDILIMNSVSEGFGRVTVEGMLAGCLIVGRNQAGTKEIIKNNINGFTFNSKEEFLDIILQIKYQKEKYIYLAKQGQKDALEKFNYRNTAINFINTINLCFHTCKNTIGN